MISARIWLVLLLSAGALGSCVTNHAALERKPSGGHGGGGGGVGGATAGSAPSAGTSGSPANGGGRADDEPVGSNRLTIVNGVVDAPAVVVCLGKVDLDGEVIAFGEPIAELDYAQSAQLDELDKVDAAKDTLQPFLIAGDLELIAGLDCEAAIDRARSVELAAAPPEEAQGGAGGADSASNAAGAGPGEGGDGGMGSRGELEVRPALRVR